MAYYSDININLTKNRSGDIEKNENIEAVKNSIQNILATMQGSRRMLPQFALNVYSMLFDPIDETTANEIGERILEAIEIWDDRVVIEEVSIYPNHDKNQYEIQLTFYIKGERVTETIDYILRKV